MRGSIPHLPPTQRVTQPTCLVPRGGLAGAVRVQRVVRPVAAVQQHLPAAQGAGGRRARAGAARGRALTRRGCGARGGRQERLPRLVSELVKEVAKIDIPATRNHFDVVVACEDEEGEDVDTPLVSIKFR